VVGLECWEGLPVAEEGLAGGARGRGREGISALVVSGIDAT